MLRLFVFPFAVFLCAGLATAQVPTLSLVPIVDDVRRECVGGPNDGQPCTSAADCEVLPECQRVCLYGPDAGEPCARSLDCRISGDVCQQQCYCNSVITAEPGDIVETEVFASSWSAYGQRLTGWQVTIPFSQTWESVLPLGWDRAIPGIYCTSPDACPPEYPICDPEFAKCVGPDHDPEQGVFVDAARPDYVFFGLAEFGPGFDFSTLDYRVGSVVLGSNAAPVFTEPKYCASLILQVLSEASGTITVPLASAPRSALNDPYSILFEPMDTEGLTIEIGTGSEPVELVPAASQWGLLVMAMLLLAGAKVYFSRRRCEIA